MRLRKLAIDGEKTLQGVAELAYQQELPGVVLSEFEHRLDRTARTYLSFIGARWCRMSSCRPTGAIA